MTTWKGRYALETPGVPSRTVVSSVVGTRPNHTKESTSG